MPTPMNARTPLLWVCGPPAVGKSTVAWELFGQVASEGFTAAYLDIDQLGLRYPTTPADPNNHGVKTRNLREMLGTCTEAGADCLVVSGVVEPDEVRAFVDGVPAAQVTWCRLRADDPQLSMRFLGREASRNGFDDTLRDAYLMEGSDFADVVVDTTGSSASEVVRRVRERLAGWPRSADGGRAPGIVGPSVAERTREVDPSPVLLVCGPTAVGKSTVAWRIFEDVRRDGLTAAYVDLEQVGFLRPAPADDPANHRVKARNAAALRSTYRAGGADCLIVSGSVESSAEIALYREAMPGAQLIVCRLRAGDRALYERVLRRSGDGGPHLAGDQLRGLAADDLGPVVEQALREGAVLDQAGIGDVVVDTDGVSVEEAADRVRARAGGWPGTS